MSSRADEYLRRADEAEKRANECTDPIARDIHLEIARQWRLMAERAQRSDRN
jgi:hypothetical protein